MRLSKLFLLRIQAALFSLNLAWIIVWFERTLSKRQFLFAHYLYTHLRFVEPQTVIEQVCWSLIIGIFIFVLVWLLSHFGRVERLMLNLGAGISIAGFPMLAVTFPLLFFHFVRIEAYTAVLVFEMLLALLFSCLYRLRKWPVPQPVSLILLLFHFGLWAWVSGCWVSPIQEVRVYGIGSLGIWISTAFYFGFPVLGFSSTLSWALYSRSPSA